MSEPYLLAVGDALVALSPTRPVPLDEADGLALHCGGAEINTAVGVRRLGIRSAWLGRLGADPLGRRVRGTLEREDVDTALVITDEVAPTGLYLREWLPDGVRRPYYYRRGSAGARLHADDWPQPWPDSLPRPTLLHVTGITCALSPGAHAAVIEIIEHASALGALVCVDPNYRAELWPDADDARIVLGGLVAIADVVLMSEDDAALLVGSTDASEVCRALARPEATVVLKMGVHGAVGRRADELAGVSAAVADHAVDPVGAGDGFNAGFLAAWMTGAALTDALRCGAWCGARAVEVLGEHTGYPRREQLPADLQAVLGRVVVPSFDD